MMKEMQDRMVAQHEEMFNGFFIIMEQKTTPKTVGN